MSVNIVIADDHGLLRAGLRSLLNAEPDLRVVGEAPDGTAALALTQQLHPDVLLADISMPGASGIEVARTVRQRMPATRVLIVSMHEDESIVREAMAAGALGYIPKRAAETDLIGAIRTVAGGNTYLPPGLLPEQAQPERRTGSDTVALDEQEKALLRLLAQGATRAQAAQALNCSVDQVALYQARLFEKLGLRTRVDLVRYIRDHTLM